MKSGRFIAVLLAAITMSAAIIACTGADDIPDAGAGGEPAAGARGGGTITVPAPIESVDIEIIETAPPQYVAVVKSAQPNACVQHDSYKVSRDGQDVRIEVLNTRPADQTVVCAQVFSTTETRINLGSDFFSPEPYTVKVNDFTTTLRAQLASKPAAGDETSTQSPTPGTKEGELDVTRPGGGERGKGGAAVAGQIGQPFLLEVGSTARLQEEPLEIQFVGVAEDSRCPANVNCIWAGQAKIALNVSTAGGAISNVELILSGEAEDLATQSFGGYLITLSALDPYPGTVQQEFVYVATIVVSEGPASKPGGGEGTPGCCAPGFALAPIGQVEVHVSDSDPPEYNLLVVSGLPNGCAKFDGFQVERPDDTNIRVQVINSVPTDPRTACTQVYGTVETSVPLGSNFDRGKTYAVTVNGVTTTFQAGAIEGSGGKVSNGGKGAGEEADVPAPQYPSKELAPGYKLAPIERVAIQIAESDPPQYTLLVVSGLPNGCARFDHYDLSRLDDTNIVVQVFNSVPTDPRTMCTQIYGTVETRVALGSDFNSGTTYTVVVNGVVESFKAQ